MTFLGMFPMLRASQGPWLSLEILSYSVRATQNVEHCIVQQFFFRLVGILARTSPAGNAYARLFFCRLEFFQNPRADFCHITNVNCRERGATLIFSLRLLLDSDISVACNLRDRLPRIVTQAFPILVQVFWVGILDFFPERGQDPGTPLASADLSSPDASQCHKVARNARVPLYLSFAQRKQS